ncbi:hypothetical protein MARPO_0010s0163 [Marchantia polymorpha]|uniref:Uncharacterized protein n=1 Tax=Marchantia polymorpha TaxID=3197 RepID=A0A2R6XL01_MARPO|nr:hypothetical protein MARPO_0010s0163 [Marchantia polymorpha]|eukprot:PTQ46787.1 hypothetical protein MARPO_0010s0163 [Marchantia polymorpha]
MCDPFSPTPSALFYGMLPSSVRPSPGPPPPPPTAPRCYLEAPLSLSPVRRLGVAVLTDPPASPQPHRRVPSSISAAGGRPINCDGDRITGTAAPSPPPTNSAARVVHRRTGGRLTDQPTARKQATVFVHVRRTSVHHMEANTPFAISEANSASRRRLGLGKGNIFIARRGRGRDIVPLTANWLVTTATQVRKRGAVEDLLAPVGPLPPKPPETGPETRTPTSIRSFNKPIRR